MSTERLSPVLIALLTIACADDESRAGSPRDEFDAGDDFPSGVVISDRDAKLAMPPDRDASAPVEPPDSARSEEPRDARSELDAQLGESDARATARDARTLDDARSAPLDATSLRDAALDGCGFDCQPDDASVYDCSEPVGRTLFEEHFEEDTFMNGEYHGFLQRDPSARVSIDPGTAARPTRSLRMARPLAMADAGVNTLSLERGLASLLPRYVSYRVKLGAIDESGSALLQLGSAPPAPAMALLSMTERELRVVGSSVRQAVEPDSWLLVQLRDIDWVEHHYDLYVDCRRIASDVSFDARVEALDRLGFVNDGVASYYDDIVIK